jgi:hypothetical protein
MPFNHTDHCNANGRPCDDPQLANLFWDQPPGVWLDEAESEFGGEAPWCVITERGNELAHADL